MSTARARRLTAFWALFILAACTVPGRDLPGAPVAGFDKLVHFSLFAVLGWLLMHASSGPLPRRAFWTAALGLIYAVGTELYQGLLPFERSPDPYDALANALGLFTAILLAARRQKARAAQV